MAWWKLFFVICMMIFVVLFLIVLNRNAHNFMGFESKRETAQRIYDKLGNIPTKNLKYSEFIRKYPEGDNALYSDIKKLDVIDVDGLVSVL